VRKGVPTPVVTPDALIPTSPPSVGSRTRSPVAPPLPSALGPSGMLGPSQVARHHGQWHGSCVGDPAAVSPREYRPSKSALVSQFFPKTTTDEVGAISVAHHVKLFPITARRWSARAKPQGWNCAVSGKIDPKVARRDAWLSRPGTEGLQTRPIRSADTAWLYLQGGSSCIQSSASSGCARFSCPMRAIPPAASARYQATEPRNMLMTRAAADRLIPDVRTRPVLM
jgi:hypothetical protein